MDQTLDQSAKEGDIDALYASIKDDPSILDNIGSTPFSTTPFHIAASEGKTHFALEIMILKPSLARNLDENGYSPMHLAAMNRHEQLVRGLVSKDKDLIRVIGNEGYTPLHSMVISGGNPSLLDEMVSACPDSIKDLTDKRETVLHLAVKTKKGDAFQVLVECIKKFHKEEIYSWLDEDGYTALHLATNQRELQMIKALFQTNRYKEWCLGVDAVDGEGRTALDIVKLLPRTDENRNKIRDILMLGSLEDIILSQVNSPVAAYHRYWAYFMNEMSLAVKQLPSDTKKTLLVVLGLVNTTSFQVGLNPPGGFWQKNGCTTDDGGKLFGDGCTTDDGYASAGTPYFAGTPILSTTIPFLYFLVSLFTMAGFISSLTLIWVLTTGMPMKHLLLLSLLFLSKSYLLAFIAISRKNLGVIIAICALVATLVIATSTIYVRRYMRLKIMPALLEKHSINVENDGHV